MVTYAEIKNLLLFQVKRITFNVYKYCIGFKFWLALENLIEHRIYSFKSH